MTDEERTPRGDQKPRVKQRLGDLLLKANLIDEVQLRVALTAQKDSGERLGTTLVELGFIEEAVLAAFLSKQADMPCINISNIRIPRDIIHLIPKDVALKHGVVPIRRAGDVLYVAMSDPFDTRIINAVDEATPEHLSITPMIAPEVSLKKCLERHYEPEKLERAESTAELLAIVDELEADSILAVGQKVDALNARIDQLAATMDQILQLLERELSRPIPFSKEE